jgi:hypothetical protein
LKHELELEIEVGNEILERDEGGRENVPEEGHREPEIEELIIRVGLEEGQ